VRARSAVPIIVVSAQRPASKQTAMSAGANDFLAKPFSVTDLLVRIESALKADQER
jgi:DNA-binding response OmpR family regulator